MNPSPAEIAAAEEHARRNPKAKTLFVTHDHVQEPWPVKRLKKVVLLIMEATLTSGEVTDDEAVRSRLLRDEPEVKEFAVHHDRTFKLLTDRAVMSEPRHRAAIMAMLNVREQVDTGQVPSGDMANATATQAVMHALGAAAPQPARESEQEEEEDRVEEVAAAEGSEPAAERPA